MSEVKAKQFETVLALAQKAIDLEKKLDDILLALKHVVADMDNILLALKHIVADNDKRDLKDLIISKPLV